MMDVGFDGANVSNGVDGANANAVAAAAGAAVREQDVAWVKEHITWRHCPHTRYPCCVDHTNTISALTFSNP
jgi:hypothetical protein